VSPPDVLLVAVAFQRQRHDEFIGVLGEDFQNVVLRRREVGESVDHDEPQSLERFSLAVL
jgi:hypothetical protein